MVERQKIFQGFKSEIKKAIVCREEVAFFTSREITETSLAPIVFSDTMNGFVNIPSGTSNSISNEDILNFPHRFSKVILVATVE